MNAGRELDALIAEKVMGMNLEITCNQHGHLLSSNRPTQPCDQTLGRIEFNGVCPKCGWSGSTSITLPHYSTDNACWDIVNHFDGEFELRREPPVQPSAGYRWRCTFNFVHTAYGVHAAHAICLAALKAVGYEAGK